VFSLPISVLAAEDYPPTFSPSVIDVGPGETVRVDLAAFTSAPVGTSGGVDRYTYRVTSTGRPPFTYTLDGSVLTVAAGQSAAKGVVGSVGLEIAYGVSGRLPVQVDLRVVASQRQLARVLDHTVTDGVQGVSRTVSVLDGAYNPFPGSPLTVLSALVETPGAGEASTNGSQVTVRPADGFVGPMVTRYRVRDVTGDPERDVEARVTVIVRGRPGTPTAPRIVEVRDRTVVLSWDAPANNGEPITGYRVTAQPGGTAYDCASTTCTIDGLTNNTEYRFTVAAQNAVDWSDQSPPSASARPDAKPLAPAAPRVDWSDAALTATWTAPEDAGSPITRYDVEISPAPLTGAATVSTSATSYTFGNLANGTEYVVRVRAVNSAPDPGDWSPWSAGQVPAARPAVPSPTASRTGIPHLGTGRIDVTWPEPSGNGDPVVEYQITVNGDPAVTLPASTTSYVIEPASAGEYAIAVRARNKAGWSDWGSTTGAVWTVPATMAAPAADAPTGAGAIDLTWTAPDSGGAPIQGYEVSVDGGAAAPAGSRTSFTVSGLAAGAHAVAVRACNSAGCGSWSPTATATVTTPPGEVRDLQLVPDDAAAPTSVHATWTPPASTGGLPVTYRYRFYLGTSWDAWQTSTDPFTPEVALPAKLLASGGEVRVEVYATNDGGDGPTAPAATITVPPPAPPPAGP
ncbi:MAG TPA: fibronectin type III domain-containing protein, partial [Actinotalea sp.]